MVRRDDVAALPAPTPDLRDARSALLVVVVAGLLFADLAYGGLRAAELTAAGIVAIAILAWATSRPAQALTVLLVFLPLQVALLSWLYKLGMPATVARDMGYFKDAVVSGICLAALRQRARPHRIRHRFDALDWFALIYVGIATAYLLIPFAVHGTLGGQPTRVRLTAWRLDCLYVVAMFAARRLPFTPAQLRRFRVTVMWLVAFLLIFSIWESISSTSYERLLVNRLGYAAYQSQVLHGSVSRGTNYVLHSTIGGATFVRAGSLIPDPITLAFYTLIPLAFGLQQFGRDRLRGAAVIGTAAAVATLIQTETRSAFLSAAVMILLSGWLAYRNQLAGRLRYATITIIAILISLPLTLHTTFANRIETIWTGSKSASNQSHVDRSRAGLHTVFGNPAGDGLGANPSTGRRFGTSNFSGTAAEDTYLTTGIELGLAGMLAFMALYLFMLRELLRVARGPTGAGPIAGALWLAGCGLFLSGFFLQVWLSIPLSVSFWALVGATLGSHRAEQERALLVARQAVSARPHEDGAPALPPLRPTRAI